MRIRTDESANYKAVFFNGKTLRFKLDESRDFGVPSSPEIEDVAINSKCFANCSYCYTSATRHGVNFEQICDKANKVWGELLPQNRPFQIAIGGAGESTIHPDWVEFIKTVYNLGIMPNYTTNGMHLSEAVLEATERYCGGVALSWHPHIPEVFREAIGRLGALKTKINAHVIVGAEGSLTDLQKLYDDYAHVMSYFVVLPYQAVGRGKAISVEREWNECFNWIKTVDSRKFAFGALFFDYLKRNDVQLPMSLYEPELFSGYRIMDDSYESLRKSSYDLSLK